MWVGSRFLGNDDKDVMWLQHDVYGQALGIIAETCQDYARSAQRILFDNADDSEFIHRFDHRTLQDAHDTIAAAWRYRCLLEVRQMPLPMDDDWTGSPDFKGHWLNWLLEEVRSWKHSPFLVRCVVKILKNQNQPKGYKAEADLKWELMIRYGDVPWEPELLSAAEGALHTASRRCQSRQFG